MNQEKNNKPSENLSEGTQETSTEVKLERVPVEVTLTDVELEELQSQSQEFKDKYFRLLAEMENARKRIQKEQREASQYAIQNLINDFLHPIDHLERALKISQEMSEEVKNWGLGFQMILAQLKEVLSNYGVSVIDAKPGDPFDPNIHEAIEMVETDQYPSGTIVEETMRGYKMNDRTIRPARVTVAKAKPKDNQQIQNNLKE